MFTLKLTERLAKRCSWGKRDIILFLCGQCMKLSYPCIFVHFLYGPLILMALWSQEGATTHET